MAHSNVRAHGYARSGQSISAVQSRWVALLLLASLALFAGRSHAFSSIVSFGDSLSDTGNVFINNGIPLAPYDNGRFSNGPVWLETLGANLGLPTTAVSAGGTNYAFGGAVTGAPNTSVSPTLLTQLNGLYLPNVGGVADPNALYVIWGGGNDVRVGNTTNSAANIGSMISTLAGAGAQSFMVLNLPDIGKTPEAIATGPAAQAGATFLSVQHNTNLNTEVDTLRGSLGVTIYEVDVFGFLNNVIANPAGFGITNTNSACYEGITGIGGPATTCSNPDEYIFWDGIHPTAYAHGLVGALATAAIPVPAAVWLFASALGVLGWTRRRRAA